MVHSSLSAIGTVEGGASSVISAILQAIGPTGTLVMPAFRSSISVPGLVDTVSEEEIAEARAITPIHDPTNTPTTMGIIPETFRNWSGAERSPHPTSSVTAFGPLAGEIVARHPTAWSMGEASPYHLLYEHDAQLLLLGVGFNRLTMLHYAESIIPEGRRKTRIVPTENGIELAPDTGDDLGTYFPAIGDALISEGKAIVGAVGDAPSVLVSSKECVDFASDYLSNVLSESA